jgi:hypothetical protein
MLHDSRIAALRCLDRIILCQSQGGSSADETTFFSIKPVPSRDWAVVEGCGEAGGFVENGLACLAAVQRDEDELDGNDDEQPSRNFVFVEALINNPRNGRIYVK